MKRYLFVLFLLCYYGTSVGQNFRAQSLFIYNFIKYGDWPSGDDAFTILVLGTSPVTVELMKLASLRKTPDGKTIMVREIVSADQIINCQILYVPDNRSKDLNAVTAMTKAKPVLIITGRDGLTSKGAGISFFTQDDDRISFELSRKYLESHFIKVSGELLRLAELVD